MARSGLGNIDLNKFVKTIAMTSSSNEGEILNAIKICNDILKSENKTWEDVLQNNKDEEIKMLKSQIKKHENNENELLEYILDRE